MPESASTNNQANAAMSIQRSTLCDVKALTRPVRQTARVQGELLTILQRAVSGSWSAGGPPSDPTDRADLASFVRR